MTDSGTASDPSWWSARQAASAIADGTMSSRELLDHQLDRIARLDGPINSVVTIDAERAHAEADRADEAVARGDELGPLHGVPVTIKDSFMTAGMRTTSGAPELSDHVPDDDAWPVAGYRTAGAVVFGKTNLPIYAGDMQSYNEVFGCTNNPYDHDRTPGGSSGGSAAALASGFTPIEIGSDIGGSIRLPATMSGVVGHKPTYGIVPAHGQIPGPPGTLTLADLAVAGPMARSVDDVELGLDLMSGPNRWDHPGWRLELPEARRTDIADYRIACWFDDEHCPVDSGVRSLLEGAASTLEAAGAAVDADARPALSFEKISKTFFALLNAALSGGYSRPEIETFAADTGDGALSDVRRNTAMRHREWLSFNERRLQMRRTFEQFFEDWDVLLMPVMPCTALKHDHAEPMSTRTVQIEGATRPYWDANTWMAQAGACFLPSTVIPIGMHADGLPVGVQIVGPYLGDRTTLDLARRLESLVDPIPRPDLVET